jgi:hypothetical protein
MWCVKGNTNKGTNPQSGQPPSQQPPSSQAPSSQQQQQNGSTSWAQAAGKGLPASQQASTGGASSSSSNNNNTGAGNSGSAVAGGSGANSSTSSNSTKQQLEQLNTMREALFSQDGWGGVSINLQDRIVLLRLTYPIHPAFIFSMQTVPNNAFDFLLFFQCLRIISVVLNSICNTCSVSFFVLFLGVF